MGMLKELLKDQGGDLLQTLTGAGFSGDEAESFLPGALVGETGVDEGKARGGLEALIPVVLSLLQDKAGGAEGLLGMLGGGKEGGAPNPLDPLADRGRRNE